MVKQPVHVPLGAGAHPFPLSILLVTISNLGAYQWTHISYLKTSKQRRFGISRENTRLVIITYSLNKYTAVATVSSKQ
jgi:hypothetical protein